tara:strand:+ start:105 stop:740 length:636 start_codon:yes stop_codon:yes gene_type:complete
MPGYFSYIPNIAYEERPLKYPFSVADTVIAKNFFKRFKLNDEIFNYVVYFNKYSIVDGERPDMIAQKLYGDPFFDWVILLTNNMVNVQYDWPKTNYELYKILESEYNDPYNEIHHYETIEIGQYDRGLRVDKAFYDKQHKINDAGNVSIVNGSAICEPVTVAEHFTRENEKKREIYLLKQIYFQSFIKDFKKQNQYKPSDKLLNQRIKRVK